MINVVDASNTLSLSEEDEDKHIVYMHGHVTPEQTAKCVKVAGARSHAFVASHVP